MIARLFTALLVIALSANTVDARTPCASSPKIVAACFRIHGRISDQYQGGWQDRIWIIGTHRMLSVIDMDQLKENRDAPVLPPNLQRALDVSPKAEYIFGDFTVCPFDVERRGWMREVCVESASNLTRAP